MELIGYDSGETLNPRSLQVMSYDHAWVKI